MVMRMRWKLTILHDDSCHPFAQVSSIIISHHHFLRLVKQTDCGVFVIAFAMTTSIMQLTCIAACLNYCLKRLLYAKAEY